MLLFVPLLACMTLLDTEEHEEFIDRIQPTSHYVNYDNDEACILLDRENSAVVPIYTDEWLFSFVLATNLRPSGIGRPLILLSQGLDRILLRKSLDNNRLIFALCDNLDCQEEKLSLAMSWESFQQGERITVLFQENTLKLYKEGTKLAELSDVAGSLFSSSVVNNDVGIGCVDTTLDLELTERNVWSGGMDDLIIAGNEGDAWYSIWQEILAEREVWRYYLEDQDTEDNIYYWSLGEELLETPEKNHVKEFLNDAHGKAKYIQFLAYE